MNRTIVSTLLSMILASGIGCGKTDFNLPSQEVVDRALSRASRDIEENIAMDNLTGTLKVYGYAGEGDNIIVLKQFYNERRYLQSSREWPSRKTEKPLILLYESKYENGKTSDTHYRKEESNIFVDIAEKLGKAKEDELRNTIRAPYHILQFFGITGYDDNSPRSDK